jgi:hypothetical protein
LAHLGFAEALEHFNLGEKRIHANTPFCEFDQSLLSPSLFLHCLLRLKKGEVRFCFACVYGRFLSINRARTINPMMITTIMPAIAGTKYMLATDVGVVVGAAGVAPGDTMSTAVVVDDEL